MGRSLEGRTVVLGVTGGVAAYKAADLTSKLVKEGAQVRVVMTGHACQFVSPATFESLSGGPVYTQLFHQAYEISHIPWPSPPICWRWPPPRPISWPRWPPASPTTCCPPPTWPLPRRCWWPRP